MSDDEERLKHIEDKLDLILTWITGNGNPSKGLIVRVDRLEQANLRLHWILGVVATGLVTVCVEAILRYVGAK